MKPLLAAVMTGVVAAAATATILIYVVPTHPKAPSPSVPPMAVTQAQPQLLAAPPRAAYTPPPARVAPVYVPPAQAPAAYVPRPSAPRRSPYKGTVISVRAVVVAGPVNPGGAILGGLAGAVVGHQMGNGRGNTAATVVGAIGGALLGNHIEEQESSHKVYDIVVRQDTGGRVSIRQQRYVAVGERVRLSNNQAVPLSNNDAAPN